jgi:hypothetical protein
MYCTYIACVEVISARSIKKLANNLDELTSFSVFYFNTGVTEV